MAAECAVSSVSVSSIKTRSSVHNYSLLPPLDEPLRQQNKLSDWSLRRSDIVYMTWNTVHDARLCFPPRGPHMMAERRRWRGEPFDWLTNQQLNLFIYNWRHGYNKNDTNLKKNETKVFFIENTEVMVWFVPDFVNTPQTTDHFPGGLCCCYVSGSILRFIYFFVKSFIKICQWLQ